MPYKDKEERKQYHKQYRLGNKERQREYGKKYYFKNREKIKEKRKEYHEQYYLNNKEIKIKLAKQWRLNNKEYAKQWRLNNKEKTREYEKNKMKTDPIFKFIKYQRSRISYALKGKRKSKSTIKLLGCSAEECWKHLEQQFTLGMTRDNYGLWHIDHILPCAYFDLSDPKQQEKCFHYTNLQPLWAIDNIKKGAKLDYETQ